MWGCFKSALRCALGWTTSKGPLQPQSFHSVKNLKAKGGSQGHAAIQKSQTLRTHYVDTTRVFLYVHVFEKATTSPGRELKLSEAGIPPGDRSHLERL